MLNLNDIMRKIRLIEGPKCRNPISVKAVADLIELSHQYTNMAAIRAYGRKTFQAELFGANQMITIITLSNSARGWSVDINRIDSKECLGEPYPFALYPMK